MALTDKLTNIGNAIREKTGKTDKLTLDEMPTEIASIESGGSGDINVAEVDVSLNKAILTVGTNNLKTYCIKEPKKIDLTNLAEATGLFQSWNGELPIIVSNIPALTDYKGLCTGARNITYFPTLDISMVSDRAYQNSFNPTLYQMFYNCYNLKKATLYSNVVKKYTTVTKDASVFYNCYNLTRLVLDIPYIAGFDALALSNTPINGYYDETYNPNGEHGIVYVRDELLEQYKTATGWVDIADYILPLSELPDEETSE